MVQTFRMSKKSCHSLVRIHLTNVAGAGASQLLQSLLPALEEDPDISVESIYLPDRGALAKYQCKHTSTTAEVYRRYLPNALSRVLECTWLARRFNGETPLLVLGDLPLRCRGPQTLFVQTSNLVKPNRFRLSKDAIKYRISRALFNINSNRVRSFIVQTEVMRDALEKSYPNIAGRVYVVSQPVPSWLLNVGLRRKSRAKNSDKKLRLIYPAACYPHKNHTLLSRLSPKVDWPIKRLTLTIDGNMHPAPHLSWITCSGFLSPQGMIDSYSEVDALLFLSTLESYGFPLVEAMFVGLPIVCPDLPYARALCGDQAIYFEPDRPESLHAALCTLEERLRTGWWPNWSDQLEKFPRDWPTVASLMLRIACKS